MSAPTAPAPLFSFEVKCTCAHCGMVLHSSLSSTEEQFKQATAKALTASELHDCKGGPKA